MMQKPTDKKTESQSETTTLYTEKVPFTMVANEALQDTRLSLKARGLMGLLMSKATIEGWKFRKAWLVKQSDHDGRHAFDTALEELKKYGYLDIKSIRGDNGKFTGWKWTVRNTPDAEKPKVGKSVFRKIRNSENLAFNNKTESNQKELKKNKESKKESPPSYSPPGGTVRNEKSFRTALKKNKEISTSGKDIGEGVQAPSADSNNGGVRYAGEKDLIQKLNLTAKLKTKMIPPAEIELSPVQRARAEADLENIRRMNARRTDNNGNGTAAKSHAEISAEVMK